MLPNPLSAVRAWLTTGAPRRPDATPSLADVAHRAGLHQAEPRTPRPRCRSLTEAAALRAILDRPTHVAARDAVRQVTSGLDVRRDQLASLALSLDAAGDLDAARAAWAHQGLSPDVAVAAAAALIAVEDEDRARLARVTQVDGFTLDEEVLAFRTMMQDNAAGLATPARQASPPGFGPTAPDWEFSP